jgi:hypothetical protein
MRFWTGLLIVCFLALSGSSSYYETQLNHDAYVWKRVWTPAVHQAIGRSRHEMAGWRVLAASSGSPGQIQEHGVNWTWLAQLGRPVTAVIRIEGQLADWRPDALSPQILQLVRKWRYAGHVVSLEIDHDAATSRLPEYAIFLRTLRQLMPGIYISVTVLPAWLNSPHLAEVLLSVDASVLQVHAVQNPRQRVFNADLAIRWVLSFARLTQRPFRVALPTYGSRIFRSDVGGALAVESEEPLLTSYTEANELASSPVEVGRLLDRLRASPPRNLQGISWFRLPTTTDQRAWTYATWQAVMAGARNLGDASPDLIPGERPGLFDVAVRNTSPMDTEVPT